MRLLDLQELDSQADRLSYRRRTHPTLPLLSELATQHRAVGEQVAAAKAHVGELEATVAAREAEVEAVRRQRHRDQKRLDDGSVSSPRELGSLQHAVATLTQRQSALEDSELEAMQELEEAVAHRDQLLAAGAHVAAEAATATARRDQDFAQMDVELAQAAQARAQLASSLPPDLLALYERVREQSGGVGAAALRGGRCDGCRIELNQAELGRVRALPASEIVRCEECRRILVRS